MTANLILAALFLGLGAAATILQHWLWRFPMLPDPTGADPNGVTSAPVHWRRVHRCLGYGFALTYLALLSRMIPRLAGFEGELFTPAILLHILLGFGIAPILVIKVLILRRFQKFGNRLRLIGLSLFVAGLIVIAIPAPAALRLQTLPAPTPNDRLARAIVIRDCTRCHGASTVLQGSKEDWPEVIEEMQENAGKAGLPLPARGREAEVADFLSRTLGSSEEDDRRGRSRSRGSKD